MIASALNDKLAIEMPHIHNQCITGIEIKAKGTKGRMCVSVMDTVGSRGIVTVI
jgi:hypothetical protein